MFTRIRTPIFYYRYVDDTLIYVKKQHIDTVIKVFNAYDINLKFTYELEEDKKINFLVMTLIRTHSKISKNWYQKPTSSGCVINYFSNHPIQQKKNIIFYLVDRTLLLSDSNFHLDNIKLIKNMLRNNDYPVWFTEKYIKIRSRKFKHGHTHNLRQNHYEKLPKLSLPFNKDFNSLSNILKSYNIGTILLVKKSLSSIIRLGKDTTKKMGSY